MFELFSDIYFIIYKLYYVNQNDDLDIRVRLRNRTEGVHPTNSLVVDLKKKEPSSI
jgi:hypothetical protein